MRPLPVLVSFAALAISTLTVAPPLEAQTGKGPFPESNDPGLRDPASAKAIAPQTFTAKFETSQGDFEVDCTREWAPYGADRFYNLVKVGFFSDVAFFRVVNAQPKPFMVQFGIHGNPEVSGKWKAVRLPVDEVKQSNTRGMLTYAMAGGSAATRTTQLFINFGNNANLDAMGFAPLCKVKGDGMTVVDKLYAGYGEEPSGHQGEIEAEGNEFLRAEYPELDYIKAATITAEGDATPASQVKTPPADANEGTSTWTYVLLAIAGVLGVFALMTMGKKDGASPPPAAGKPSASSTSARKSPPTDAKGPGGAKKKKKSATAARATGDAQKAPAESAPKSTKAKKTKPATE